MTGTRPPNVMIVEDEALLRAVTSDHLRDQGFSVIEASAAEDAVALLEQHPDVDVLFTDVSMPGVLDGLGLAFVVRRMRPHVPVIMTSGIWAPEGRPVPEGVVFLQKPYSVEAVAQLVKALVRAA